MNWQPIETAPKNVKVLVYRPDQAYFVAYFQDDATDPYFSEGDEESDFNGAWVTYDGKMDYRIRYGGLTHWMPLPEPPKETP